MRLTLRTMLAYLDEILEPADAAEMGKKIEESEFATSLLHRTRDVTRRLRLGAPKVDGRGMGLDPNTVAEYLDHNLPAERVPDFEKVCLESDVHLAEVASAHQILALVLGEPAEFDARSRERMYGLASVGEQSAAAAENDQPATPTKKAAKPSRTKKRKKRRRPEVPEYLRETPARSHYRRWLVAAFGLLVLAAGGALVLRARSPETWRRLTGQAVAVRDARAPEDAGAASDPTAADDKKPSDPSVEEQRSASAGDQGPAESGLSERNKRSPAGAEDLPSKGDLSSDDATSPPANGEDDDAPTPPMPSEQPLRKRAPKSPPDSLDEPAEPSGAAPRAAASGEIIGRLISDHDVLLKWNVDESAWQRVPGRESIHAGDRLLALPAYQPSLALGAGVTVQLLGGAAVQFDGPDADGAPGIRVDDGRVLLMTVAKPDVFVRIQAGDHQGTAAFGRDDATLAIEVTRDLPDGIDPEAQPAAVQVDLYVSSGEVTWVGQVAGGPEKGAGPEKFKAPSHRALNGNPREARDTELPAWIKSNDLSPIEKRARTALDEYLAPGRPVSQALRELAGDKRWEKSLLALRSLTLIGEFEPCVAVFRDDAPNQKNAWTPLIESLRAAMRRGPDVAARVRAAFQSERGEANGAALCRMLWGFTPEQLQEGADAQLVEYLSHEDLDFRVLSFWNLHHITGWLFSYRPEYAEAKRRLGVAAWKQKLAAGQIVPAAEGE